MNRKYDFTSVPDRSRDGAAKWTEGTTSEFVPLSVADMEFYTAPEIKNALKELDSRLEKPHRTLF